MLLTKYLATKQRFVFYAADKLKWKISICRYISKAPLLWCSLCSRIFIPHSIAPGHLHSICQIIKFLLVISMAFFQRQRRNSQTKQTKNRSSIDNIHQCFPRKDLPVRHHHLKRAGPMRELQRRLTPKFIISPNMKMISSFFKGEGKKPVCL